MDFLHSWAVVVHHFFFDKKEIVSVKPRNFKREKSPLPVYRCG